MAATGAPEPRDRSVTGKSPKAQNQWQIYVIIVLNTLFLYGVAQANAISIDGLRGLFSSFHDLVPVAFALVVAVVVNGILPDTAKDRLVFLRWKRALPGHRAFSVHAREDARISLSGLLSACGGVIPVLPEEQNARWYEIYLSMGDDESVRETNKSFLLTRDYAGLAALFFFFYGAIGAYAIHSRRVAISYLAILAVQYLLVRQAASNYGIALVRTVLARRAGGRG